MLSEPIPKQQVSTPQPALEENAENKTADKVKEEPEKITTKYVQ